MANDVNRLGSNPWGKFASAWHKPLRFYAKDAQTRARADCNEKPM
jgi:hypothetical protein